MFKPLLVAAALVAAFSSHAAGDAHWTYSGEGGPQNWAKLTPEFGTCAGKSQSPINLTGFISANLPAIRFAYQAGGNEILNNGHTIQVNVAPGSSIKLDGTAFALKQFHFHAPSENLIEGKSYPLEAHLVHADADGNLAVVAVMFKEGKANAALEKIWPLMPREANAKAAIATPFAPLSLLPHKRAYFRFSGSLTTPPCSEGVRWLVLKSPVSASKEQVEAFAHVMHHPNNRPVQAVNARTVLR